jgi:hypothetical protein
MRAKPWRVRVMRSVETWTDVTAQSAAEAEAEAAKVPGVLQVFARSAIRADLATAPEPPAGVREE